MFAKYTVVVIPIVARELRSLTVKCKSRLTGTVTLLYETKLLE